MKEYVVCWGSIFPWTGGSGSGHSFPGGSDERTVGKKTRKSLQQIASPWGAKRGAEEPQNWVLGD